MGRRKDADMVQVKTIDLGGINNIIDAVLYCKSMEYWHIRVEHATKQISQPLYVSTAVAISLSWQANQEWVLMKAL